MPATPTTRRPRRKVAAPAAATAPLLLDALGDQRIVIPDLTWEEYVAINDAIVERPNMRMIYCDGRLTLLTESRKHDWYAEMPGSTSSRSWPEFSGSPGKPPVPRHFDGGEERRRRGRQDVLFRRPRGTNEGTAGHRPQRPASSGPGDRGRGHPFGRRCGDRLGPARRRRSLAIRPDRDGVLLLVSSSDGTYDRIDRSLAFPMLTPDDVIEQMRLADELGSGDWYAGLGRWVRKTIVPRGRRKV